MNSLARPPSPPPSQSASPSPDTSADAVTQPFRPRSPAARYALAVLACVLTAALTLPLRPWFASANVVMLFLLAVFLVAWLLGRGPALLAAFLAVALFDVLFVLPYHSFAVEDAQYLVTFGVMLAVALVTGQLAAEARERLWRVQQAQAERLRAEAERLRHSILASLSHDLRTPLAALVGLADALALAQPRLPAPHAESAQQLQEQARALAEMVDQLLELARLTQGREPLKLAWQPLEEVVGAALRRLGAALAAHPVAIELAADFPLLEFDAVLIERVLGNLLDNAAKHTPPGTPVRITASIRDAHAEICVTDAGAGWGDEQAAATQGMGLAICRAIVTAHRGELRLVNDETGSGEARSGGARACFTLPLGTPPQVDMDAAEMADALGVSQTRPAQVSPVQVSPARASPDKTGGTA